MRITRNRDTTPEALARERFSRYQMACENQEGFLALTNLAMVIVETDVPALFTAIDAAEADHTKDIGLFNETMANLWAKIDKLEGQLARAKYKEKAMWARIRYYAGKDVEHNIESDPDGIVPLPEDN